MGFLRTLFAITIVFAHSPWNNSFVFVGGQNAVQLFYIISGFLISYVVTEKKSYQAAKSFYISRYIRLWPMYIVVAAFSFVFAFLFNSAFFDVYRLSPLSADLLLGVANTFLFGQDWIMFSGVDSGRLVFTDYFGKSDVVLYTGLLVPQAWSLGVELSFYLIAPFVLPRRKWIYCLLGGSLLLRAALAFYGIADKDPWTYRFFPTELALFLLGALSHQVLLPFYRRHLGEAITPLSKYAVFAFAAIAVGYCLMPLHLIGDRTGTLCLLSGFVLIVPLTFVFQNASKLDARLGELSYPIYIGHLLIIQVCHIACGRLGIVDALTTTMVSVVFSILFAVALNATIGKRIEAFRQSFKEKTRCSASIATTPMYANVK